jgi:hypothetical protein
LGGICNALHYSNQYFIFKFVFKGFIFHSIWVSFLQSVHLKVLLVDHKCVISLQKWTQILKFCIFDSYIELSFFIQFWCWNPTLKSYNWTLDPI